MNHQKYNADGVNGEKQTRQRPAQPEPHLSASSNSRHQTHRTQQQTHRREKVHIVRPVNNGVSLRAVSEGKTQGNAG